MAVCRAGVAALTGDGDGVLARVDAAAAEGHGVVGFPTQGLAVQLHGDGGLLLAAVVGEALAAQGNGGPGDVRSRRRGLRVVAVEHSVPFDAVDGAVGAVQHGVIILRLLVVQVLEPDGAFRAGAVEEVRHLAGGEGIGALDAAAGHRAFFAAAGIAGQLGIRIAVGDGALHRAGTGVVLVVAHEIADAVMAIHGIAALEAVFNGAAVVAAHDGAGDSAFGQDAGAGHIAILDGAGGGGGAVLYQQAAEGAEPAVVVAFVVEAGIDDAQVLDGAGDRAEQAAGELCAVGADLDVGDGVPLAVKGAGVALVGGARHSGGAVVEGRAGRDGGPLLVGGDGDVACQHRVGGGDGLDDALLSGVPVDQGREPEQLPGVGDLVDTALLFGRLVPFPATTAEAVAVI